MHKEVKKQKARCIDDRCKTKSAYDRDVGAHWREQRSEATRRRRYRATITQYTRILHRSKMFSIDLVLPIIVVVPRYGGGSFIFVTIELPNHTMHTGRSNKNKFAPENELFEIKIGRTDRRECSGDVDWRPMARNRLPNLYRKQKKRQRLNERNSYDSILFAYAN